MSQRVLFVDDDQMLLSSMERCLGLRFDFETAISGPEALRKIEESDTFPVIVSDMRMPVMDGIQFIERARAISKTSVFMMLTGNQDVRTAARAVNEGQVFRFLNKPTDPADIGAAIETAQRQHQLETAERDILNKTFLSAVGIFADVMETLRPDLLSRAATTENFVEQLLDAIGMETRWEIKTAAKLSMVGAALHPLKGNPKPSSTDAIAQVGRACETTARMIERIPRMELVSQIVRSCATSDGEILSIEPRGDGDVVRNGAALLRVANLVEGLSHVGVSVEDAESEIQKVLPKVFEPLLAAARSIYPLEVTSEGILVDVDDLRPGMVLHDNLVRPDGATLLRSGRRLTETHIDKLQADRQSNGEFPPVSVTSASFQAEYPEAELAKA